MPRGATACRAPAVPAGGAGPREADGGAGGRLRALFLEAIREEVPDPQMVANLSHLVGGLDEEELWGIAAQLAPARALPPGGALEALAEAQRRRVVRTLDPARRTAALYFPTPAYREQLGDLARGIAHRGHNAVTFVGTVGRGAPQGEAGVFYGGNCGETEIVSRMDMVEVFLTPTLVTTFPPRSRKVYFVHDIHDSPLGDRRNLLEIARRLRAFDYVVIPSPAVLDLFRQVLSAGGGAGGGERPLRLIPGGYIKLDRLLAYCQRHGTETRTLIYAPTVAGYGMDDVTTMARHGERIVAQLLEAFPDHTVVFRPHPHSLGSEAARAIVARYGGHPRFALDDQPGSTLESYARAALMVTDLSGTAFTYAFATLRPVVFVSPNEREVRRRYPGLRYLEDRARVGCVVEDLRELAPAIRTLLGDGEARRRAVRDYRDATIYNVGRAEAYFLEHFDHILRGTHHPEWPAL